MIGLILILYFNTIGSVDFFRIGVGYMNDTDFINFLFYSFISFSTMWIWDIKSILCKGLF